MYSSLVVTSTGWMALIHYVAENWYVDCLNIKPQTFCSLVEIKEKAACIVIAKSWGIAS